MQEITWDQFEQVEMRVGTILHAEPLPKARKPAYKLIIDFGEGLGQRQSSAQITVHYTPEELIGKQIVAVVNFPPKLIAGFRSECLVMGVYDNGKDVVLLAPSKPVSNGSVIG